MPIGIGSPDPVLTQRAFDSLAAPPAQRPLFRSAQVDRAEPTRQQTQAADALLAGSAGTPLPLLVRRSMEQRFGVDLGAVRVHSGPVIARAADLLAARAMTMGTDVFFPSGIGDRLDPATEPLIAHELSHVASHAGGRRAIRRAPMVLAQRASTDEQHADQIERLVADEVRSRTRTISDIPPADLTLARSPATMAPATPVLPIQATQAAPVQREVSVGEAAVTGATGAVTGGTKAPDASELAEKVFAMLERRLLVERERGGFRRI